MQKIKFNQRKVNHQNNFFHFAQINDFIDKKLL